MKFSVIANCQSGPMANLLMTLAPSLEWKRVKAIHLLQSNEVKEFDHAISDADYIFHQPIGSKFKEFSIEAIKTRFPSKLFISFPSLYFKGYCPWLMYLRNPKGGTLKGPIGDYHDERIVSNFIKGLSIKETIDDLCSHKVEDTFFNIQFANLESRESKLDAQSSEYIKTNFKSRKLFYVFNHPANDVMIHIALQLLSKIQIGIDQSSIEVAKSRSDYLRRTFAPIDHAVKRLGVSAFDDGCYGAVVDGVSVSYSVDEYVDACFRSYSTVPNMPALYEHALDRQRTIGC